MRIWFKNTVSETGSFTGGIWDDGLFYDDAGVWNDSGVANNGVVRIYADGVLRFTRQLRSTGEFMRLPSGFKAQFWEVELESDLTVTSIELATSAKELANA
jgi:hypothetical protein